MKVHNIRFGFATNSSSAHSVVWALGLTTKDNLDGEFYTISDFVLADEQSKLRYLGQQLKSNLERIDGISEADASILASHYAGVQIDPDGSIDHQSVWRFPLKNGSIDYNFFAKLKESLLKNEVCIVGGSDVDLVQEKIGRSDVKILPMFLLSECYSKLRAREDSRGYWSIFDITEGTKVRISLTEESVDTAASDVPEVVEIKIASCCNSNCSWCYQDSKREGVFSDNIRTLDAIDALGYMGSFEIVFGGGDPCLHPHFIGFLKRCRIHDIVPSFSTRNLDWLEKNKEYHKLWGTVGISVNSVFEMNLALKVIEALPEKSTCFHIIVGTQEEEELSEMLTFASYLNRRVLLLGYKALGRAKKFDKHKFDISNLLLNQKKLPVISVDTSLAKEASEWLEAKSNKLFWTTTEGTHSMYIDMVDSYISPSSFSDKRYHYNECSTSLKKTIEKFFPFPEEI